MDIKNFLSKEKNKINQRINFHLENAKEQFKNVSKVNYDVFERLKLFSTGGKGVRGGLFIATAELFEFTQKQILLDIAASLEILHASLLIHDDIMDNDQIRRGNSSIYAEYIPVGQAIGSANPLDFGKSMGICIGDIGFFVALNIFQDAIKKINIKQQSKLYKIIFQELIAVGLGQMDDIRFSHANTIPKTKDILSMYTFKTAHYTFSLPFVLAAVLTNQSIPVTKALEQIGMNIGILFQIKDDEIGLFSTENNIGKPIGSDIRENKKTLLRAFLENKMNNNEKKDLRIIIKKKNISHTSIQTVIQLLKKYGVKKFTEKIINDYYLQITSAISTASISKEHKKMILNLTNYVVERTS